MSKRKRILLGCTALVLAIVAVAGWRWSADWVDTQVSFAAAQAVAATVSGDAVEVTTDDWIVFRPRGGQVEKALVFYPGGLCDPRGYAEPLRAVAEAGYLVVIVPMPFYLAVLGSNRADDVVDAFPEIRRWAVSGHSLGGAMAARFAARNPGVMDGLLLWDAYPPENDDLSGSSLEVTVVHRAGAEGAPPSDYVEAFRLLPADARLVPIPGGSHINFGRFDAALRFREAPQATIALEEQHRLTAEASIAFMAGL